MIPTKQSGPVPGGPPEQGLGPVPLSDLPARGSGASHQRERLRVIGSEPIHIRTQRRKHACQFARVIRMVWCQGAVHSGKRGNWTKSTAESKLLPRRSNALC